MDNTATLTPPAEKTVYYILFAISFLELLICGLQAYVFVTLVSLYINDIMHMH